MSWVGAAEEALDDDRTRAVRRVQLGDEQLAPLTLTPLDSALPSWMIVPTQKSSSQATFFSCPGSGP